ncbi:hypothetical protein [Streptomyces sp. NPDC058657]|uniref:hypothetical protein n=1 Tax=unclassified Streptomyces TaxID=2593676 RepID=UPI0036575F9D
MTYQDTPADEDEYEAPEPPAAVRQVEKALRALGIDPDSGGAYERPAIAAGRLLAAAEVLARDVTCSPDDPNGQEALRDLMHGFFGFVVAFSSGGPTNMSSALRGALLQDRLRRSEYQATHTITESDDLVSALDEAIEEAGRLRAMPGMC